MKWISREIFYPDRSYADLAPRPEQLPQPTQGHAAGSRQADEGALAPQRRYAGEITEAALDRGHAVAEVDHPDAATAVAAAAAAVAQANGLGPDQPVIVVVAEDIPDWIEEDPGF